MTDTRAASWLTPQPNEIRVLHVEDNEVDAELVAQALRRGGFSVSVVVVQEEAEFERQLRLQSPDVVIADYKPAAVERHGSAGGAAARRA